MPSSLFISIPSFPLILLLLHLLLLLSGRLLADYCCLRARQQWPSAPLLLLLIFLFLLPLLLLFLIFFLILLYLFFLLHLILNMDIYPKCSVFQTISKEEVTLQLSWTIINSRHSATLKVWTLNLVIEVNWIIFGCNIGLRVYFDLYAADFPKKFFFALSIFSSHSTKHKVWTPKSLLESNAPYFWLNRGLRVHFNLFGKYFS